MLIDFRKLFPKYNLIFSGVLHVGANVGEEADVYIELGMKHQIWIEANPEIFEKLKENIQFNPNAVAYNFAAGDIDMDNVTLHVSNNASQSSSVLELGTHIIEHPDVHYEKDVVVPMRTIANFFLPEELGDIDFLNIDVQGFELNVLKGIGDKISNFKAIYLEVNKDFVYRGCALIQDIDNFLGNFGFERVETKWAPNKNWGDALYIQKF